MSFIVSRTEADGITRFISGPHLGSGYLGVWRWTTDKEQALHFDTEQEALDAIKKCRGSNECSNVPSCAKNFSHCSVVEAT